MVLLSSPITSQTKEKWDNTRNQVTAPDLPHVLPPNGFEAYHLPLMGFALKKVFYTLVSRSHDWLAWGGGTGNICSCSKKRLSDDGRGLNWREFMVPAWLSWYFLSHLFTKSKEGKLSEFSSSRCSPLPERQFLYGGLQENFKDAFSQKRGPFWDWIVWNELVVNLQIAMTIFFFSWFKVDKLCTLLSSNYYASDNS